MARAVLLSGVNPRPQAKSELFKFFFRKTDAEKKKKTPPGAEAASAPACLFFIFFRVHLPKKKLKQLGFRRGLIAIFQLQC